MISRHPIDLESCSFLRDHAVGGIPLLPTVLQLDLAAGAAQSLISDGAAPGPTTGLRLSRIQVLEPVLLDGPGQATLTVLARPLEGDRSGPRWELELQDDEGSIHLRADVGPLDAGVSPLDTGVGHLDARVGPLDTGVDPLDARVGPLDAGTGTSRGTSPPEGFPGWDDLPGTPNQVYPPLFHGPAFQVVGGFGRSRTGMLSRPAPHVTGWPLPGHASIIPTVLLELALQTCGVWELAETGQMMRPSVIDEVLVPAGPRPIDSQAHVHAVPRRSTRSGGRVFDAAATDPSGRLLVGVGGYRPVPLPHRLSEGAQP